MHHLNKVRLNAGLTIRPELEVTVKESKIEPIVERNDVEVGYPITRGGKHRFYLVQDAGPEATFEDIISEVDTLALVEIARGSGAKRPYQEKWELFPAEKRDEAISLAEARLKKAQAKDPVGEPVAEAVNLQFFVDGRGPFNVMNNRGDIHDTYDSKEEAQAVADKLNAKYNDRVNEAKKADKDYDKDGEVETSEEEHKGAVDKAIKKEKSDDKEKIDEMSPMTRVMLKAMGEKDPEALEQKQKDERKAVKAAKKAAKAEPVAEADKTLFDPMTDKDENPKPNKDKQSIEKGEEKVACPANLLSMLKKEIGEAEKEAEYYKDRDEKTSEWYGTLANAMGNLHDCLKQGTHESMQRAQIEFSSWMSIMQHKVPSQVVDFIMKGGQSRGLRDIYKEVKVKSADGVDPTKGSYVK